jgi:hypothetical protein
MLGLNDGDPDPWSGFARMKFSRPYKLGIAATIGSLSEALHRNTEQALAQEHDQVLELTIA